MTSVSRSDRRGKHRPLYIVTASRRVLALEVGGGRAGKALSSFVFSDGRCLELAVLVAPFTLT